MITKGKEYEGTLKNYNTNQILILPTDFLIGLPPSAAILLAYLSDRHQGEIQLDNLRKHDNIQVHPYNGWFVCTHAEITEKLHLTPNRQQGAFKKLKADGIIKTNRWGIPAKRYVQIQITIRH